MRRSIVRGAVLAVAMIAATSSAASAETRMFSYDPISPDAKRLTGAGVTILFKDGFLGAGRPLKVLATGVPAQAMLKAARAKDLGPDGLSAMSGVDAKAALYAVDASAAQGKIYVRAFCPGSARLWLSFSPIAVRRDLRIQAFGDDPKTPGQARLCGTLDFSYRGEWRLPDNRTPDPMSDWTDNPQRPDVSN
ncbi:hypothetical protein CA606_15200 [Caulobacter vibrioides]|uniref:Uncharacterized protein n=1 Tax=Caulobacter vibrioides TaxID=155892 RepID=A0A290MNK9_CAUVI|nr:hypothetical protein [Caulobacter vibrioides]ATC33569.1 hypothetical protein CA606_15200 [Caulobacter vibrioides]